jgi:hypothetical protein
MGNFDYFPIEMAIDGCFPCYRSYLMYGLSLSWSQPEVWKMLQDVAGKPII